MPQPQNAAVVSLRTEHYKKLINEKCPQVLESTDGKVFASIIISLSDRVERLERENAWLKQAVKATAHVVNAMAGGEEDEPEETEAGATTPVTGAAGSGAQQTQAAAPRDERYNQPFPAGVPSSKAEAEAQAQKKASAPAAAAAAPSKTGPAGDGDMTPNVAGGPAMNAQPIPKNGRQPNA